MKSNEQGLPEVINVGDLPAGQAFQATYTVTLPGPVDISCDSAELAVSLAMLGVHGQWGLTLAYPNPRQGILIQSRITLTSPTLNAAILVVGRVVAAGETTSVPQTQPFVAAATDDTLQAEAPTESSPLPPPSEQQAGPLRELRAALHTDNDAEALAQIVAHPQLSEYLLPAELSALEHAKNRVNWVEAIRTALLNGDEAGALRLSAIPNAPLQQLRAGEQAQLAWLSDKHTALPRLRQSLQQESDQASADYWSALAAGIRIPAGLGTKARAIRLRHSRDHRPDVDVTLPVFVPFTSSPSTVDRAEHQSADAAETAERAMLQRFTLALEYGSDDEIATVASEFSQHNLGLPRAGFERYQHSQRRRTALSALRSAIDAHDTARAARLWAYAHAHWPSALPPADDEAGRAAFRSWGAHFRQKITGA